MASFSSRKRYDAENYQAQRGNAIHELDPYALDTRGLIFEALARMIGWTSGRFWNHTVKAQRPEIQLIDKHVDHPHRVASGCSSSDFSTSGGPCAGFPAVK